MRKMLAKKKTSEPTLSTDPFSVDDVGKRFQMLKAAQMNVQENYNNDADEEGEPTEITNDQIALTKQ